MPILYNQESARQLERGLRTRGFSATCVSFNQILYIEHMLALHPVSQERASFIREGLCFALSAYFLRELYSNPHLHPEQFFSSLENPIIFNKLCRWVTYTVTLANFIRHEAGAGTENWDVDVQDRLRTTFRDFQPDHEEKPLKLYPSGPPGHKGYRPSQFERFKFLDNHGNRPLIDIFVLQRESFFWNKVTKNYTGQRLTMEDNVRRLRLNDYHRRYATASPQASPEVVWDDFWEDVVTMVTEYSNEHAKSFICGFMSTVSHAMSFAILPSPVLLGQGTFMVFDANNGLWTIRQRTRFTRMKQLLFLIHFQLPVDELKSGKASQANISLLALKNRI